MRKCCMEADGRKSKYMYMPDTFSQTVRHHFHLVFLTFSARGQARLEDVLRSPQRPGAVPEQGRARLPQERALRQHQQLDPRAPRRRAPSHRLHQEVARLPTRHR